MKTLVFLLAVVVLAGVEVQAADPPWPPPSKPTWKGDEHDPPVYTSPTNDVPAVRHFTNAIIVPVITKWPATNLPTMTNWPATNHLPTMTNPPALQPPGGK
jgi:hypothetical protein